MLTESIVYRREIIKNALHNNESSTIFSHNIPFDIAKLGRADELFTQELKKSLDLGNVRVLDHIAIQKNYILLFC
jgi:DNA repair protein RadC